MREADRLLEDEELIDRAWEARASGTATVGHEADRRRQRMWCCSCSFPLVSVDRECWRSGLLLQLPGFKGPWPCFFGLLPICRQV